MTRFDINKAQRTPEQWSAIAFKQTAQNNIQWNIAGGLIVAAIAASATSPVTGLLIAAWSVFTNIKKAQEIQRNQTAIREYGCVAHVLDGDDFRGYLQQVGKQSVEEELNFAADQGYSFSDAALNYAEAFTPQVLQPQTALPVLPMSSRPQDAPSLTQVSNYQPDYTIDIIAKMTDRITNTLIIGVPGTGKGMLLANAIRAAKSKHLGLRVFVIDPKADPKEAGYFEGIADRVERFRCADASPEEVIAWLERCFNAYNEYVNQHGRTLLILDEGTILGNKSNQLKSTLIQDRLVAITSCGDSEGKNAWVAAQSPYVKPLGLTLDTSSQLSVIALARDYDSVKQWGRSPMLDKVTNVELERLVNASPCGRAIYFGKEGGWFAMPSLQNYSGFDRDNRTFVGAASPQDALTTQQRLTLQAATATQLSPSQIMIDKLERTKHLTLEAFIEQEIGERERLDELRQAIILTIKNANHRGLLYKFKIDA
ncbi:hypothetical protein [Nostoc sp. MG11]|uniref:hypothetical protein n=1 Tax=Nostoc sp. MG11 TaxID=2721166 RepID=UPI00186776DB|nr:hypothetical protein [Nostoc sp. MG11]